MIRAWKAFCWTGTESPCLRLIRAGPGVLAVLAPDSLELDVICCAKGIWAPVYWSTRLGMQGLSTTGALI